MKFYNKKLVPANENLISYVNNINDLIKSVSNFEFDLVVVSEQVFKKKLIDSLKPKILNLHTGLSPYVNGGPNCTNWCISNDRFDLIGNTVMYLNEGIDSGNIISSKKLDLINKFEL